MPPPSEWAAGLRTAARIMGPAFLVSVSYADPGNWAVAIEAGSRFGYQLVWVVVLSNLIAIQLQTLAARLGLVTGKNLAQVCRESYPRSVCVLLWLLSEVSIVALDATMVVGTAVGLNLLFKVPLLPAILATSLDGLLLLLLVPRRAVRSSEALTVGLLAVVVMCFIIDLAVSRPQLGQVVAGLVPRLQRDSVATAVSIVGANVMPHSFFLHSALVSGQARGQPSAALRELLWFNALDVACALGVALVVNVAILLVSAATFHEAGIVVETLQAAHDSMERLLSSSVAPAAFGTALLCAGQLSTFTGTIAGQVVLRGFLNVRVSTLTRRLLTRMAAIAPAAALQAWQGDKGTYKFLLVAQVVLALQLPFTLVPLIKATSSSRLMGQYKNSAATAALSWGAGAAVFLANALLLGAQLAPGSALLPRVEAASGPEAGLHAYLDGVAALAWERPGRFLLMLAAMLLAAVLLALQLWMVATPLRTPQPRPLLALRAAGGDAHAGGAEGEGEEEWQHDGRDAPWRSAHQHAAQAQPHQRHVHHRQEADAGAKPRPPGQQAASPMLPRWLEEAEAGSHWGGAPGSDTGGSDGGPQQVELAVQGLGGGGGGEGGGEGEEERRPLLPGLAGQAPVRPAPVRPAPGPADGPRLWLSRSFLRALLPWRAPARAAPAAAPPALALPAPVARARAETTVGGGGGRGGGATASGGGKGGGFEGSDSGSEGVPDSWDDLDLDRLPLPSPSASAAASAAGSMRWPYAAGSSSGGGGFFDGFEGGSEPSEGASSLSHTPSWATGGCGDSSWPTTPRSCAASASGSSASAWAAAATKAAPNQQQQQQQQQALDARRDAPVLAPSSSGGRSGGSAIPSAAGPAAALAAAIHDRLSKSQRRKFAAVLDAFWAQHYDSHGRPRPAEGPAAAAEAAAGGGGGGAQQPALSPLACAHARGAAAAANGALCPACGDALLAAVRGCIEALSQIGGAAAVLRSEDAGIPSAAAPGGLGALPLPARARPAFWPDAILSCGAATRHLQAVAALASGNLPWAHATAAAPTPPSAVGAADAGGADASSSGGGGSGAAASAAAPAPAPWQWQGLFGGGGGAQLQDRPAAAAGAAAIGVDQLGAALFVSWGAWCALVLLVWAQIEVRPELLGCYAPTLNRLQGLITDVGLGPQQQQQQQQQREQQQREQREQQQQQQQQEQQPWWPWPPAEREALRALLLAQLAALEAVVRERQAAAGSGATGAYASAKRITHSVVTRLRRRLLHGAEGPAAAGPAPQRDGGRGDGGSDSGAKRPRQGGTHRRGSSGGGSGSGGGRGGSRPGGGPRSTLMLLALPLLAGGLAFASLHRSTLAAAAVAAAPGKVLAR